MRTLRFTVDDQTIRKNPDCDFSGLDGWLCELHQDGFHALQRVVRMHESSKFLV